MAGIGQQNRADGDNAVEAGGIVAAVGRNKSNVGRPGNTAASVIAYHGENVRNCFYDFCKQTILHGWHYLAERDPEEEEERRNETVNARRRQVRERRTFRTNARAGNLQ